MEWEGGEGKEGGGERVRRRRTERKGRWEEKVHQMTKEPHILVKNTTTGEPEHRVPEEFLLQHGHAAIDGTDEQPIQHSMLK